MKLRKNTPLFKLETKATTTQQLHWRTLYRLFNDRPIKDEELMVNMGLFLRSSALVKILFLNELYQEISQLPGFIMEFGVWYGQNLAVFENLRAVYEPFNQTRKVIGFDTFRGYPQPTNKDQSSEVIVEGGHEVPPGYVNYLRKLLDWHEKNNILGHIKKHEIIEGDVLNTVPEYFKKYPHTVVALAYFDLALYKPTLICLQTIKDHLIPGSVLMLDEFNHPAYPGETIAFKEVFGKQNNFTFKKSHFMTDRTLIIMR